MNNFFTNVYETKTWGDNQHTEYSGGSGEGSSVFFNIDTYIPFLKKLIK